MAEEVQDAAEAAALPSPLLRLMMENLPPQQYHTAAVRDDVRSIHLVPPSIRECDPEAYEPQIVSVGPYHRGKPGLAAMEDHKWRYLRNLLDRKPQQDCSKALEVCIEKIRFAEARARRFYEKSPPAAELGGDGFVLMLILDGCFILELMLTFYREQLEDDPLYAVAWMVPSIWNDLFKLENQIPFFVLEDLFNVAAGPSVTDLSLRELVFGYLMLGRGETRCLLSGLSDEGSLAVSEDRVVYHLLHFYYLLLLPTAGDGAGTASPGGCSPSCAAPSNILKRMKPLLSAASCILPISEQDLHLAEGRPQCRIPTATELRRAGIKLRRKTDAKTFLDVTFGDGALEIPVLFIDGASCTVLRNVITFEQCCPRAGDHFSAYRLFLGCVLKTGPDVALLQRRGILENGLGSGDEETALLVGRRLGKEVTIRNSNHYLARLFREVNEHCSGRSKWRKRRVYGSPRWLSVSVAAAAVALLVMTLVQVTYVVLSYHTYVGSRN